MEKKISSEDKKLKEDLVKAFREGKISAKEIPPRFREEVIEEVTGRTPTRSLEKLLIIEKRIGNGS